MIGMCNARIKKITIEVITGEAMRSIAASLMKANDDDVFMVFIQKTDAHTSISGDTCQEIDFKRSISL